MTRFVLPLSLCCGLLIVLPIASAPAPPDSSPRTLVAAVPVEKGAKIVTVNASNGTVKDLTDGKANDGEPAWSPDGRKIVFVSDRDGVANLYVMNSDGSKVEQLTREKLPCTGPRWSPDGKHIAFISGPARAEHVWVVDADGGNLKQLTKGAFSCRQPAWSPDSKKLTYSQYGPGVYETCVMNADGSGATVLTNGGGLDASWAPDGKRIAFVSVRNSRRGGFRLYVTDADGKNVVQYSTTENTGGNAYPAWSPDGKKIAFGDLVDGRLQVCVCNADGTSLTTLTKTGSNTFARWSPDGKKISCARFEANKKPALWVMDADGKNERELLPATTNGWADWKPK
jgi:TolB protein